MSSGKGFIIAPTFLLLLLKFFTWPCEKVCLDIYAAQEFCRFYMTLKVNLLPITVTFLVVFLNSSLHIQL